MSSITPDEEKVSESISKELVNTSIDLGIDYTEISIDDLFNNSAFKEIPIIKTIIGFGKIGLYVKEKFFIKKLFTFLREFHSNTITPEAKNDFNAKFNNDTKYRQKVTEFLMVYIDRIEHVDKAKILSHLFSAHLEGKFDWETFTYLSFCLDRINPKSFKFLKELSDNNFTYDNSDTNNDEALLFSAGIGIRSSALFIVTPLGKDLYNYGISKLNL